MLLLLLLLLLPMFIIQWRVLSLRLWHRRTWTLLGFLPNHDPRKSLLNWSFYLVRIINSSSHMLCLISLLLSFLHLKTSKITRLYFEMMPSIIQSDDTSCCFWFFSLARIICYWRAAPSFSYKLIISTHMIIIWCCFKPQTALFGYLLTNNQTVCCVSTYHSLFMSTL